MSGGSVSCHPENSRLNRVDAALRPRGQQPERRLARSALGRKHTRGLVGPWVDNSTFPFRGTIFARRQGATALPPVRGLPTSCAWSPGRATRTEPGREGSGFQAKSGSVLTRRKVSLPRGSHWLECGSPDGGKTCSGDVDERSCSWSQVSFPYCGQRASERYLGRYLKQGSVI